MAQIRLHVTSEEKLAKNLAEKLYAEFDDDLVPVALFESSEDERLWTVSLYVEETDRGPIEARTSPHLNAIGIFSPLLCEHLEDVDWVSQSLRDLVPVRAGQFIVHGSHDIHVPKPHEIAIHVDAGQAFGTGHHGTTAGCLDLLSQAMKRYRHVNVLDLGTGSGVLAIAAAKAQPVNVLASDIDAVAVEVAKSNVKINGMANRVKCITATGFNHREFNNAGPFDLIIANILARPLESLAQPMRQHLAKGATVILSGLLPHQKSRILSAYRQQGLRLVKAWQREGWLSLMLQ